MATGRINYLARDFDTIKAELIRYTELVQPELAKSLQEQEVLQLLLNWFAMIGDILSYQIDMFINEAFLDTSLLFESKARIAKLVGLVPKLPVPSTVVCTAELSTPQTVDVTIPKGTMIRAGREVFETVDDFVIPAGQLVANGLVLLQGRTVNDTFTAQGIENETFLLSTVPVTSGSISVNTAFGAAKFVPSLALLAGPDNAYEIEVGNDYSVRIRFGDNVNGAILPAGSQVNVTYRVLETEPLVIPPNLIQTTIDGVTAGGARVTVTIFNSSAGITGSLGDTPDELTRAIKQRTQRVSVVVTKDDLQRYILDLRIVDAVSIIRDSVDVDKINIYVWVRDSVTSKLILVPQTIIDTLINSLEKIRPVNVRYVVLRGKIVLMVFIIDVTTSSFDKATVEAGVRAAVNEFFVNLQPGQLIQARDMEAFIQSRVANLKSIKIKDGAGNLFGYKQLQADELADVSVVNVNVMIE